MAERLSNLGYGAFIKEATPGVPLTPTIFFPVYKESMVTDLMLDIDNPIIGQKYKNFQVFQGQREHKGGVTVLAEPNTMAHWINMLLYKSGTSGGGDPYTHSYVSTSANDASTYTLDLAKGQHVFRYFGVRASSLTPSFNKNKMEADLNLSALGSFTIREVASTSGSGPYTITLNTAYDPNPTLGLVASDVMQWYKVSDGTYTNFTVASVSGLTTLTTVTDITGMVAGDIISLRPQTPSYSLKSPFLWSSSEFRFASSASSALSATHTPVEQGSMWVIKHELNADGGEHRSGSIDPAALARLQTDADLKIKYFFDDPKELDRFMNIGSRALVIRHFSYDGGVTHELRLTFNQIVAKTGGTPPLETGKLIYQEADYVPVYKAADTQAFDVKVINALSTI